MPTRSSGTSPRRGRPWARASPPPGRRPCRSSSATTARPTRRAWTIWRPRRGTSATSTRRQLLDPAEAGEDEDFARLTADPRYAELAPAPKVEIQLEERADALLLGERYTVELLIRSRSGQPLEAALDPVAVGLQRFVQERAIEDIVTEEAGWTVRRLTVDWRAQAAGVETVGPVNLTAHGSTATFGPLNVEVTVLGGREAPQTAAGVTPTLWLPSAVLGAQEAPWIGRLPDGRPVALMLPGMSARSSLEDARPLRLEHREQSQTQWLAEVFPASSEPQTLTIRRGRRVILEQTP